MVKNIVRVVGSMNLLQAYLRNAEECRKLAAAAADPAHRKLIEEICETWEMLAEERRQVLEKSPHRRGK